MNTSSKWIIASMLFVGAALPQPAHAESMRCGTHIISTSERQGTGKYEVLKKCGEPSERYGNTWVYNQPGGVRRTVVFSTDGRVQRIE